MADEDKVVVLPDDDDKAPRNQDQRGNTGRGTDAKKLEADVEKALKTAGEGDGDEKGGDAGVSADDQAEVAKLRRQLDREKRRADAAEARVNEADGKVADALDKEAQANLNTLKTAKTHLEGQRDDLKRRLTSAHSEGDFEAIADIQDQLMKNTVQMGNIENGIIAIENLPKQREALARRGEPGDARFHQITKGMDPAAKQWFRDNPEYYQDDRRLQRVIAAHNMVVTGDDPPEVNSPEYFAAVELQLGDPKFNGQARSADSGAADLDDDPDDALSDAASGQSRRSDTPPASAPPSRNGRGAGGANNGNGREVRLSRDELEMAEATGQTPEEFARNKRALVREGRIGSNGRRVH